MLATEGLDSKPLLREGLRNTDLVINHRGQTRVPAFANFRRIEDWPAPDPYGEDDTIYQTISEDIERRLKDLSARLRKTQSSKG